MSTELDLRRTQAQDLLRELLEEARRDNERDQAAAERLRALVRAGHAAGLGPGELAEASGFSRPGVYEVLRRAPRGPIEGVDEIALAALGATGATTRPALAAVLRTEESRISESVDRLIERGLLKTATAGYDPNSQQEVLLVTPAGHEMIDDRLRYTLSGRPEYWTAYIAVKKEEAKALEAAAQKKFGRHRTALLSPNVARDMAGPELAISLDVADEVGLLNAVARAWHDLREDLSLPPTPVELNAVAPPRFRSRVLEAFGRGAATGAPKREREIMRLIADSLPQANEHSVAVTALTEAAWALRRAVGQSQPPPKLSTGEDAFQELQAVAGLRLDAKLESSQRALVTALELATDRLGPLPGGGIGRFQSSRPNVVDEVTPTATDLSQMAQSAGEAVGHADTATGGEVSAVKATAVVATAAE